MQQPSHKPTIRLNFSYAPQPQPLHHPSPTTLKNPSPSRNLPLQQPYNPHQFPSNTQTHHRHHQSFISEEQMTRNYAKGLTVTSNSKSLTDRSLQQHKHIANYQNNQGSLTAREGSMYMENGIIRNNFSQLRIKLTHAERQKNNEVNPLDRSMLNSYVYHSTLNLQNSHTPKDIKMRLKSQNQSVTQSFVNKPYEQRKNVAIEQDISVRLKTQNLNLSQSNHFQGRSDNHSNIGSHRSAQHKESTDQKDFNSEYLCGLLTKIKNLEENSDNMRNQLEQKNRRIAQLQEENEDKDSALDEAARRISQMNDSKQNQSQEVQTWKNKALQLEDYLQRAEKQIVRLNKQLEANPRLQAFQRQFASLKEKSTYFEAKASSLEEQLSKMSSFAAQFKVKNQMALKDLYVEVQVIDNFRTKYREVEELKKIYAQKVSAKPEQPAQNTALLNQIQRLKKQNEQMKIMCKKTPQPDKQLTNELNELRKIKEISTNKIKDLNNELNTKQHQISILLDEISQLKEQSLKETRQQ